MAEGLIVDPAAELVDATAADPHEVKRVRHAGGVGEVGVEAGR
jgi:hypothetical protein